VVPNVSDPANPVPYLPRPIHIGGEEGEVSSQTWLVSDQRDVASRPDVLSFVSAPLSGQNTALDCAGGLKRNHPPAATHPTARPPEVLLVCTMFA
jgi:hypothetical protein